MENQRVPSVPLVCCDPYFSLWSPADKLYQAETVHWTGMRKKAVGSAVIDGKTWWFMGRQRQTPMRQTGLRVDATTTTYLLEGGGIELTLRFCTPLLPEDFDLLSRPCSYVDYSLRALDGKPHTGELNFGFDAEFCYNGGLPKQMTGGLHRFENMEAAWMGRTCQMPLCHSGDLLSIDWGYLYLAAGAKGGTEVACKLVPEGEGTSLSARFAFLLSAGGKPAEGGFVLGYDDIASIHYFGDIKKGWWARNGATIIDALALAIGEKEEILHRCQAFDRELWQKAEESCGADYAALCALSWRQVLAAHKLIADNEGQPVFISKECHSNGSAATADISYPSCPMLLLYAPKLVEAMLRPIVKFAALPVWEFDFAPHDAGRYPYLTGQNYGAAGAAAFGGDHNGAVYPPYYLFPAGEGAYLHEMQMPVEESGNMLIMAAAAALVQGDAAFAQPHFALWEKWALYLEKHGEDPGEQLCTDDFAGHLAHNVNLAAKAVMGLEAYSVLLRLAGRPGAEEWHEKAARAARRWEERAQSGDHTALTFGGEGSWSIKYNLIWDLLFQSGLFSPDIFEKELGWYLKNRLPYGLPLDSRETYTKSDWILWAASMAQKPEQAAPLIADVARYVRETPDRVPFCDWYDSTTAGEVAFQNRSVQGGIFMPLLKAKLLGIR